MLRAKAGPEDSAAENWMTVTEAQPPGNPLTELSLRCQSCGAPYAGSARGEILTCTYCGTSQRIVDARQFLDHFLAQVASFVRQAVPPGLDLSPSQTVDPVARLAAFNGGIRPRLATESDQYPGELLPAPLVIAGGAAVLSELRFSGANPATVSIFAAQVQSVSGLAVDDSSRELLNRAGGLASCYQSLLVAVRLSSGTQAEAVPPDISELLDGLGSDREHEPLVSLGRPTSGLAKQTEAVDLLLSGREVGETVDCWGLRETS